jgi:hypothetical protein
MLVLNIRLRLVKAFNDDEERCHTQKRASRHICISCNIKDVILLDAEEGSGSTGRRDRCSGIGQLFVGQPEASNPHDHVAGVFYIKSGYFWETGQKTPLVAIGRDAALMPHFR